jgi:hypothetical protein
MKGGPNVEIHGKGCSRHRKIVLVLWLVALAGSFGASRAAGTSFSNKFALPGTQSGTALSQTPVRPRAGPHTEGRRR